MDSHSEDDCAMDSHSEDDCAMALEPCKRLSGKEHKTEGMDMEYQTVEQTDELMANNAEGIPANAKCSNPECCKTSTQLFLAPLFALHSYEVAKKKKALYICHKCFQTIVEQYEKSGSMLVNHQPLYSIHVPRPRELVEILDSSDEEETMDEITETPLPPKVISLVANEFSDILENAFKTFDIGQQIEHSTSIINERLDQIEVDCNLTNDKLKSLRNNLDEIQQNLYDAVKYTVKQLPEIHFSEEDELPPPNERRLYFIRSKGALERQPVEVNEVYFGVKGKSLLGSWNECKVLEKIEQMKSPANYKVQFLQGDGICSMLPGKRLAYSIPSDVRLQQGTRVIAKIDITDYDHASREPCTASGNSFYAGIVAEPLSLYNNHRYLIIFDNGYTFYAYPWNVRVVCEQSTLVWEDVDSHSREFVLDYMSNYKSVRPMVQVKEGQRVLTEKNEKWYTTTVVKIDGSLMLLDFPDLRQKEWIFRGSKRLAPLYYGQKHERQQISKFQKRNVPSIEYITIDDDESDNATGSQQSGNAAAGSSTAVEPGAPSISQLDSPPEKKPFPHLGLRFVARKSTAERSNAPAQTRQRVMNNNIIYCDNDRPQGSKQPRYTKNFRGPDKYIPHECSPNCLFDITFDLKTYNLLTRPMICGWEREVCKTRGKRTDAVVYRAPCGRRLRYIYELHRYLRITKAQLNVEHFNFDCQISVVEQFVPESLIFEMRDLSYGKELMPVSCVNYYDDTQPPPCEYSTVRIPTEGVNLNLDDNFLCGCDCEDDCFDKSNCQCWQLTIQGALHSRPNTAIANIGYVYKRLDELVLTGIYECNSRCKCKVNECLNRVVQHPLQTKLQVFKTSNRGWGIRCLNDVPKGSFICIYTGHLLTEETSNLICAQNEDHAGDEYFADLDFIETVENLKHGYESEAIEPPWNRDDDSSDDSETELGDEMLDLNQGSDDDFTSTSKPSERCVNTRAQLKQTTSNNSSQQGNKSGEERERVNLIPNSLMDVDEGGATRTSVRQLFGENEQTYVMDAKRSGNLGRYFNHSCVPNLFVQNVFVDTHDLRFPWVAFFSSRNIEAGSELTWNYNYDVGSVPGKVLYCNCGEAKCRKRLL